MNLSLIPASEADIALIMNIERMPGYDALVGRSSAEEHRRRMARADAAHWLAVHEADPARKVAGFAIVTGVGDPHSGLYLLRIAVAEPGLGLGSRLLKRLVSWAFDELKVPRFSLDVFAHNTRARRAYAACGFVEEGVLRSSYEMPDGSRVDRVVMSIVASDRVGRSR
jgi:RimJ/RimL family protein N-acetyltransferase